MHRYLRAIGFSQIKTRSQVNELLAYIIRNADEKKYTSIDDTDVMFAEYSKEFAENIGLTVRGEYNEDNQFIFDYYFPFIRGIQISSYEDISIERHAEKESYAGVCDDIKVGVTLIFYLQNIISYLKVKNAGRLPVRGTSLVLSGLSTEGRILLPIKKNKQDLKKIKEEKVNRSRLLMAARHGDEKAMESLTLEDIDMYTNVTKKLMTQDVYTLVDSYFMPYGVECDQYSILGEIMSYEYMTNKATKEELCQMTVNCNDLIFDICINRTDLTGEPEIGRRFKGVIWLQGNINFPD